MLHILLHRPFLPEGHLRHMHTQNTTSEPSHREICLSSALQIYELAKLYRNTFTLRRATYMFSYCLFCAASVIPFGPSAFIDLSQRHIIGWFWIALKELQNGANFGVRKPIVIIRSLIEHAGLDLGTILAQTGSLSQDAGVRDDHIRAHGHVVSAADDASGNGIPVPQGSNRDEQGLPELEDGDFERLCRDLFSGDIDGLAVPSGINADDDSLLYGLFR